jgi:hypothetical protein
MTNRDNDDVVHFIDDEYDNEVENLQQENLRIIYRNPSRVATVVEALVYVIAYVIKDHPRASGVIKRVNGKLTNFVREMKEIKEGETNE